MNTKRGTEWAGFVRGLLATLVLIAVVFILAV